MRYVGIDLASKPARTGWAVVDDLGDRIVIEAGVGATDDDIVERATAADKVGIDAPFGWPEPFIALVTGQAVNPSPTIHELARVRYRSTDFHVRRVSGRWPRSVSTDLIGVVAIRCSRLQAMIAEFSGRSCDKDGSGLLAEVYPAAALRMWNMSQARYKTDSAQRRLIVADLMSRLPDTTRMDEAALVDSDDALDAVLAALVARAVKLGAAIQPTDDQAPTAATEGWIHLPEVGSEPWVVSKS